MAARAHYVIGIGSILVVAASLTACGGSSKAATSATSAAASASASPEAAADGGNFLQSAQVQAESSQTTALRERGVRRR
jgi:hypothetical protein